MAHTDPFALAIFVLGTTTASFVTGLAGFVFLASIACLMSVTQVLGQQMCKPSLAFKEVHFSEMQPPTLKRTWTAVVSVDAAGCAANSTGHFEIVFSRLKEIGPDIEFREKFKWLPPSVKVAVDFWADEAVDEAVERYRIDYVSRCSCVH
jgi:hypothetical protein